MKLENLSIGDMCLYNTNIVCYKIGTGLAKDQWNTTYYVVDDEVEPVLLADGSILKNNQVVYFDDYGKVKSFTPYHVNYKKPLFELVGYCGNSTIYKYANGCYSNETALEIGRIKHALSLASKSQLDFFGNVSIQGDNVNIFALKERLQLLKHGGE